MEIREFLVATFVGGVQEHPNFTFENVRVVRAHSKEAAIAKYQSVFKVEYWIVGVLADEEGINNLVERL